MNKSGNLRVEQLIIIQLEHVSIRGTVHSSYDGTRYYREVSLIPLNMTVLWLFYCVGEKV